MCAAGCVPLSPFQAAGSVWYEDYMYCKTCYELKEKGNFCPLCLQCYQDSDFNTKVGGVGEDGRGEERREEGSEKEVTRSV